MILTLRPTTKLVELKVPGCGPACDVITARIWEGTTESGAKVHAFIPRVALHEDAPDEVKEQFGRELQQTVAPSAAVAVYPLRLIL